MKRSRSSGRVLGAPRFPKGGRSTDSAFESWVGSVYATVANLIGASAGQPSGRGVYANVLFGHALIHVQRSRQSRVQFVVTLTGENGPFGAHESIYEWSKESPEDVARKVVAIYERLRSENAPR